MNTPGTSAAELRSFVERIQVLEGEIADINSDKRDVYTEAKSKGFDVAALKGVVAYLRKDREKAEEQQSLFELYLGYFTRPAFGGTQMAQAAPRVHAHARKGLRSNPIAAVTSSPARGDEAASNPGAASPISSSAATPTQASSSLAPGDDGNSAGEIPGHSLSQTDAVVVSSRDSIVEPAPPQVSTRSGEIGPVSDPGLRAGSPIPDLYDIRNQPSYREVTATVRSECVRDGGVLSWKQFTSGG
jgi:uncharacterized protein (UPF0335 family)